LPETREVRKAGQKKREGKRAKGQKILHKNEFFQQKRTHFEKKKNQKLFSANPNACKMRRVDKSFSK